MAYQSKNPLKAKYVIKSLTTDGRKMEERCDNKKQVSSYVAKIIKEERTNIRLYTLTPFKSLGK
jgi:hypothetical protein